MPVAERVKGMTAPTRRLAETGVSAPSQRTIVAPWLAHTASATVWPVSSRNSANAGPEAVTGSRRARALKPSSRAKLPRS